MILFYEVIMSWLILFIVVGLTLNRQLCVQVALVPHILTYFSPFGETGIHD
jgi:hypothetical protein